MFLIVVTDNQIVSILHRFFQLLYSEKDDEVEDEASWEIYIYINIYTCEHMSIQTHIKLPNLMCIIFVDCWLFWWSWWTEWKKTTYHHY